MKPVAVTLVVSLFFLGGTAQEPTQPPPDAAHPGTEFRIEAPKSASFALVYVPTDYAPERTWPVILSYHGAGGRPSTWPFRQVTDGSGFVVIGMNYVNDDYYQTLPPEKTKPEKAYVNEVLDAASQRLNLDRGIIIMGGFSQGGYSTTVLGEQMLDRLAGLVILGAGRRNLDRLPPNRAQIQKKPIFVGVGANDSLHNGHAHRAVKNYKAWGASVTFEEWPELGHRADERSIALADWLADVEKKCRERDAARKAKAKSETKKKTGP